MHQKNRHKQPATAKDNAAQTSKRNAAKKNSKPTASKQIKELEQQVADLTADLQRVQADFVNFRRRVEQEHAGVAEAAKRSVIAQLLPVLDNIGRALAQPPEDLRDQAWVKGIEGIAKQLSQELSKLGVETLGESGQPFNPQIHEAVAVEGEGEHEVVDEVLQAGYSLNRQVVRPALVKVKRHKRGKDTN